MAKIHEQIAALNQKLAEDEDKSLSGNSSAGTRARKTLQEIRKVCAAGRQEIQERKNAAEKAA